MPAKVEGHGAPSNQTDESTTKTMLSLLTTIQESMNSSNLMLLDALQQKHKFKSSQHTELAVKRKKLDSDESHQAVRESKRNPNQIQINLRLTGKSCLIFKFDPGMASFKQGINVIPENVMN